MHLPSPCRSLVLGAALLAALAAPARAQWIEEPIGRTAVLNLRSAPFPHPSRPQFRDDRVLAFVPAGYTPGPLVDIVVHYHGHRADAVSSARERRLREQLAASDRGAILLAPQGPLNASDSAGGKHEEAGGLQRFLDEAIAALVRDGVLPPNARVGRVILSGHSGAYRVIARGLERGGVEVGEVWLHDAVYAEVPTFARWAAQPGRRLVSTHTPGGGTRVNNGALLRELRARGVPVVVDERDIEGARAAILAVPEGHNAVTKRFERFLRTSRLDDRSTQPTAATPPPTPGPSRGIVNLIPR